MFGRLAFLIQRMKPFPLEIISTHCEAPLASNSTTKGVFSRNFSLAQYKEIPFFAITKVRKVGVDPCKITAPAVCLSWQVTPQRSKMKILGRFVEFLLFG